MTRSSSIEVRIRVPFFLWSILVGSRTLPTKKGVRKGTGDVEWKPNHSTNQKDLSKDTEPDGWSQVTGAREFQKHDFSKAWVSSFVLNHEFQPGLIWFFKFGGEAINWELATPHPVASALSVPRPRSPICSVRKREKNQENKNHRS